MTNVQIVETDELPKCPYCGKDLDRVEVTKKEWGKTPMYRCPYCKKLLHIATDIA